MIFSTPESFQHSILVKIHNIQMIFMCNNLQLDYLVLVAYFLCIFLPQFQAGLFLFEEK